MIGLTAGLEIARKALSAYQLAISVYGNNIANVDTPGFSRRRPILQESESASLSFGRVGLGVDTEAIRRMRDVFLDSSYRREHSQLGKYESMDQTLAQIEQVFGEPSDTGLGSMLEGFWNSWQELANQPESTAARMLVVGKATSLCDGLNRMSARLDDLRTAVDAEIRGQVEVVNSLAERIAALNSRIVRSECSGAEASDLRDQRDLLLDQLSEIVDISVFERGDGSASVRLGSETLVERSDVVRLGLLRRADGNLSVSDITWGDGTRVIMPTGGKLGGLIDSRDRIIPRYLARLDEVARGVVENVNAAHAGGYDLGGTPGADFFDADGLTASNICVSEMICQNLNLIAASADGSEGSGDNALRIAGLRLEGLFGADGAPSDEYYGSIIGELGTEVSRIATNREGEELLLGEIETRRESVKGVSLDEEMTNLIAAQHAYEAAVRLVTVIDELMETILSSL
jgi:flagellar hook-associated protein 1 FlgK